MSGWKGTLRGTSLAVAAATLAIACGAPKAAPRGGDLADQYADAVQLGWDREADWLADGELTKANVEAAWQTYATCVREGGGDVGPARFSPIDSVNYLGDTLPNGLSDDAFDRLVQSCTPRLIIITGSYVATHERRVDDGVVPQLTQCLQAQGMSVTDRKSLERAVWSQDAAQGNAAVAQCVLAVTEDRG